MLQAVSDVQAHIRREILPKLSNHIREAEPFGVRAMNQADDRLAIQLKRW